MDSQSFGILLIILIFSCAALIAILQNSEVKQREVKLKKDIELALAGLERKQTKNHKTPLRRRITQ